MRWRKLWARGRGPACSDYEWWVLRRWCQWNGSMRYKDQGYPVDSGLGLRVQCEENIRGLGCFPKDRQQTYCTMLIDLSQYY